MRITYYESKRGLDNLLIEHQYSFNARHDLNTYSQHNINVTIDPLS